MTKKEFKEKFEDAKAFVKYEIDENGAYIINNLIWVGVGIGLGMIFKKPEKYKGNLITLTGPSIRKMLNDGKSLEYANGFIDGFENAVYDITDGLDRAIKKHKFAIVKSR